uniref:Uncharacterized protein n=1 Tax=Romanomermis culicivorax TaxID=13658 RepID=A0A915LDC4_ROMCU
MISTTSADTETSANRITVAFLLDDSTTLNSLLANVSDAISNFAALMSPYEYDRLANYLLEVYTSSDSTLLGERFTGEDLITLLNSYVQSSGPRPITGFCAKTNLTNLYRAFSSILKKATKNCVIYWLATSNMASVDLTVLDSVLSYLTTKQCRIDVILYEVGCSNETLDSFGVFSKISRFTGGSVYKLLPSQTSLDDLFAIFAVQTLQPRLLLEKSQRFVRSTTVRFPVDKILTDLLIVIQGCNLNFNLRDNRGSMYKWYTLIRKKYDRWPEAACHQIME